MRRGSGNFRFVSLHQVAVSDIESRLGADAVADYSDNTHVVIKARSYYRKMPLHNGVRFNHILDLKLTAISTMSGSSIPSSATSPEQSNIKVDPHNAGDLNPQASAGSVSSDGINIVGVGRSPRTLIHYVDDEATGGDKEIYLFVDRLLVDSSGNFGKELKGSSAAANTGIVRFNVQVDFMDGSTTPVVMEIRRMPIVVIDDNAINRIQVGPTPGGQDNWMQFGTQIRGEAGYGGYCQVYPLYSFMRYGPTAVSSQNQDIATALGAGSNGQPYALPAYRLCSPDKGYQCTPFGDSSDKATAGFSWISGKSVPWINSEETPRGNDITGLNIINLGQFFEMNRVDALNQGTGVSGYGSRSDLSWGRLYGVVNYFSANNSANTNYPYNAWPGTAGAEGSHGHGKGPSLGWAFTSLPEDDAPDNFRTSSSIGYDVQAGESPSIYGSTMYAPRRVSHIQNTLDFYSTPQVISDLEGRLANPQHNRCFFSSPNAVTQQGTAYTSTVTTLKDSKTSYFQQAFSVGSGSPMVTAARCMLVPKTGLSAASADTAAYLTLVNVTDIIKSFVQAGGDLGTNVTPNGNYNCLRISESTHGLRTNHSRYALFEFKESTVLNNGISHSDLFNRDGVKATFYDIQSTVSAEQADARPFANMPVNGIELMANALFGYGQLYSIDTFPTSGIAPGYNVNGNAGPTSEYLRTILAMESPETTGGLNSSHNFVRFNLGNQGSIYPAYNTSGVVTSYIPNATSSNWQWGVFGNPFQEISFNTPQGTRYIPRASFAFAGYQDVYFITSFCATTQRTIPTSIQDGDVANAFSFALGNDVFMAETGTHYEGASTGAEHGSYYYDDSYFDEYTSGKVVYNYSYQDNFDFFLYGSAIKHYFSGHAFNTNATCKCTDITLSQGRDNISGTIVPSGYQQAEFYSGTGSNVNYWGNSNNYNVFNFNNGAKSLVYYTGVAGPSNDDVGGAEPCDYSTGSGGCLQMLGGEVWIADYSGYPAGDFIDLTVQFRLKYINSCSGTGPDAFKAGSVPNPSSIADILSIWDITYIPGNAGQVQNAASEATYFNYAFPIQVIDADDIYDLEIKELPDISDGYELVGTFTNTENFLTVTSLTEPISVFPDLPMRRKMPGRNYTLNPTATTDTNTDLTQDPNDIQVDSFRSAFFNALNTTGTAGISDGARHSKFITQSHTGLDGVGDSGNSYVPYRTSRVIIKPKSTTYKDASRIFDFVTYGEFRELSGCTDPNATNYNPNAINDDGSCIDAIFGCTDAGADNYDPNANTDDGSCTFCESRLGIFSGGNSTRPLDSVALSNYIANSPGGPLGDEGFHILAGYNDNSDFYIGSYNGLLGNGSGINGEIYFNQLGEEFSSYAPDYYDGLKRTGAVVSRTNTPLSTKQYGNFDATSGTNAQDKDHSLDINVIIATTPLTEGDNPTAFADILLDETSHSLRVYTASDTLLTFLSDNNANTGNGQYSSQMKFITEDSNGHAGFNSTTNQSSLENAGFTPLATINNALSAYVPTAGGGLIDRVVARFRLSDENGSTEQIDTLLTTDTLYVLEYFVTDKECASNNLYPAFYTYTMIGRCGCVDLTNDNAPTTFPWQVDGVNSFPVAHDGTDCVNSFNQGPGDSGQLCFSPDNQLSDCESLYEFCLVTSTTQCLYDSVTSFDDPDIVYVGGQPYAPSETTVIVQIDGIYNPTTNTYEWLDQNTGQVTQYLNYTITPSLVYVDGTEEPSVLGLSQGMPEGTVTDSGIQHTFTFVNVAQYGFTINFVNPPSDSGIYQGHTAGPNCVQVIALTDTLRPEGNCEIFIGCTDPDAINFDPTATVAAADGVCEYTNCDEIFLAEAGGYSSIEASTENATVTCTTATETIAGVTVTNTFPVINADGTATVKITTDTADFPEFIGTTEAQIAIAPANIIGLPGITSETDLIFLILNQAADTDFATNGGNIPIAGAGVDIFVSKKQIIDVPVPGGVSTDFVNRDFDVEVADADGNGKKFENLAPGEYFIFVFPPQADLFGSDLANSLGCTNEAFYYLDNVTRTTVGLTDANPPCEEDCGNPLGCDEEVYGCTDPDNVNYNPDATIDNGSCEPTTACDENATDEACFDCETEFSERIIGGVVRKTDGVVDPCDPTTDGDGCTDPNACNYDPNIDASNSNNQLCDYCSCVPDSVDCCEGEDCGCDPEVDDDCAPPPPPDCPDPTNPDCNTNPPIICYDPEDCPPVVDPCAVIGNCPDEEGGTDPDPDTPPVIDVINPISVPCEPLMDGDQGLSFEEVQNTIMACHANQGSKLLLKMKSGIGYDEEDILKLDLISYLFLGGIDRTALPCLFNCNYKTTTKVDKYSAKERWAITGGKRWARSNAYKKGEIVAYYYNTYGQMRRGYFQAIRDIEAQGVHPRYKDSGWRLVREKKAMTVDPLGISDGTENYLMTFFEFYRRFCDSCEVAADTTPPAEGDNKRSNLGITKTNPRTSDDSSIIGPDGEEIIF